MARAFNRLLRDLNLNLRVESAAFKPNPPGNWIVSGEKVRGALDVATFIRPFAVPQAVSCINNFADDKENFLSVATAYELLSYAQVKWDGKISVVAFGSHYTGQGHSGYPVLHKGSLTILAYRWWPKEFGILYVAEPKRR